MNLMRPLPEMIPLPPLKYMMRLLRIQLVRLYPIHLLPRLLIPRTFLTRSPLR